MTEPIQPPTIAILDFGAQYVQLIARRVREHHVHSVIVQPDVTVDQLRAHNVVGLIFSGGPASVYADDAPRCRMEILDLNLPILGICYGMQLACQMLGGDVQSSPAREFGRTPLRVTRDDVLLSGVGPQTSVWMSHGDIVHNLSPDFQALAQTPNCPFAAVRHRSRPVYGAQFHTEVAPPPCGNPTIPHLLYALG